MTIIGMDEIKQVYSIYSAMDEIEGFKEWFSKEYECDTKEEDFDPLDHCGCDEDAIREFYEQKRGKYHIEYDTESDYFKIYKVLI